MRKPNVSRARIELVAILLAGLLQVAAAAARADSDHYAGLQLGASAHAGHMHQSLYGGVGAELSLHRWLAVELTVSGVTRPFLVNPVHDRLPAAVRTSLGVLSRVGGGTHAFVYGLGLSYYNRYECPRYCSFFAAWGGQSEDMAAPDLLTLDIPFGYEARLESGFFLRGIMRLEAPLYISDLISRERSYPEETSLGSDYRSKFFLLRLALQLTVGYAFQIRP